MIWKGKTCIIDDHTSFKRLSSSEEKQHVRNLNLLSLQDDRLYNMPKSEIIDFVTELIPLNEFISRMITQEELSKIQKIKERHVAICLMSMPVRPDLKNLLHEISASLVPSTTSLNYDRRYEKQGIVLINNNCIPFRPKYKKNEDTITTTTYDITETLVNKNNKAKKKNKKVSTNKKKKQSSTLMSESTAHANSNV